ncbi:MAG: hypothetical protein L0215_03025 [Gemmataceae bacterium]|nr:hypothetical protein [Gemmataceae bacterium]
MHRCLWLAGLAFLLGAMNVHASKPAATATKREPPSGRSVPLHTLAPPHREAVRQVVEKPTLAASGPAESFPCRPEHYQWLLEHPDRAVTAWRRLGAKCVNITTRGGGQFGWTDDQGSDVIWETVCAQPGLRIWLAEGKVRPAPLMPLVPVKAVVVLRHNEGTTADGLRVVRHQSDLFVQTDSKTAALMTKMLGPTSSKMAEQGLGQLQLFFSGLSWYLERHPDRVSDLFREAD